MGTDKRLVTAVVVALLAALALGPGSSPAQAAHHKAPVSVVIFVGQSDNNAIIDAQAGDLIVVQLQSGWRPPGGWHLNRITGHAVEYLGEDPPPTNDGTFTFRLKAVKKGSSAISFLCTPPPGGVEPMIIGLFQFTADVQPQS